MPQTIILNDVRKPHALENNTDLRARHVSRRHNKFHKVSRKKNSARPCLVTTLIEYTLPQPHSTQWWARTDRTAQYTMS